MVVEEEVTGEVTLVLDQATTKRTVITRFQDHMVLLTLFQTDTFSLME